VYVVKGDKVDERIVTTGETVGQQIEVTSGLSAGEVVAAAPKGRLTDGAAVRVRS
jgi:multidrug efflux pump subunit AcrA (membrane-fusion protein)